MPHPTAVILVVGLNQSLIGDDCPRIRDFAKSGHLRRLKPVLPAVTTSMQSSMLTGLTPGGAFPGGGGHGIVGNGWYDRELCEVQFWKQSNKLVRGEKVWETARKRDPSVTTLNMFWWYNMYSTADFSVTPRPMYKADGRKIPDCYSNPPSLRDELQAALGPFPLFQFWGPGASIKSTQWIADATKLAFEKTKPALTLVYLPHLDYAFQKYGPPPSRSVLAAREGEAPAEPFDREAQSRAIETGATNTQAGTGDARAHFVPSPSRRGNERLGGSLALPQSLAAPPESIAALREVDTVVGDLIDFFTSRGVRTILVSEYGIEPVDGAIPINRVLREAKLLKVREEQGLELLDAGASSAFAVADHQVAHVYLNEAVGFDATGSPLPVSLIKGTGSGLPVASEVGDLLRRIPGVECVLDKKDQIVAGIAHERSGDFVLISEPGKWFSYDYWLDDAKAPDFARTVDIHRKPGYDPLELFIDPKIKLPKLKLAWRLFQRKALKQRALLDIIPLDTKLVRGSHGRVEQAADYQPVVISQRELPEQQVLPCTAMRGLILNSLFDG